MTVRIGISGWTYPPWRSVFYPKGLPQRDELAYAAGRLSSIELNGSFYALQRPTSYYGWAAQTPPDFVFSVKGGRFITHLKKLAGVETALANFFGSGVLALEEKLGPLLWQLPPTLGFDPDRLVHFFHGLPRSTGEAAFLARRHDDRIAGRAWTGSSSDRPLRHALEVRHRSFDNPEFAPLLREHQIGLVVADSAGKWPQFLEPTADFVYVRLHGAEELYSSGYDAVGLNLWADRIRTWRDQQLDVYCYFDNDVKVRAPFDAMELSRILAVQSAASTRAASRPA
jgi:uncharacterized protein YecE (DUF72 family)